MTVSQSKNYQESLDKTKTGLSQYFKHFGETKEAQIEKNQAAIKFLQDLQAQKLEGEDLKKQQEAFEFLKQIIDENRSPGQKLYS